ncbi:MAG: UPF0175 family protein [Fibrobacteres bacterium]|nr:UPF0175 family protein [Fibrobacterota bacterium]
MTLTCNIPDTLFATVHKSPTEFMCEMRLAAAVKWYELGELSQEKAAEISGLSRASFIDALARYSVSPFQETPAEIVQGLNNAD